MAAQDGVDPKTFNYADPDAKIAAEAALRHNLGPYRTMRVGKFPMCNLCFVLTNCAAFGLGAYFQHQCYA